ncbi:putative NAD(P)-binding protein [Pacificibacter maritimus]|uniref:Putative NAD(P)-binding protein n=1 Tax=Pacificibacter maritimus TaxID=762213 RepID=A0A3N4UIC7_9RHOB|nr:SDR family oxidoreductase [Pacificibacter maritimus]RPE66989.1 putative NAD(P)-binding protein [Pacificibacter maritimus]
MTKNILIAGATGKTGRILTQQLIDQGQTVTALVRESSDTSQLPEATSLRQADLTNLQSDDCDGADVVVFAAGSGGTTGPDMTDKVDRDGAMRLIDLAKEAGVERFVMLSSIGADQSNPSGEMAHYLQAKHDADEHLKASGLTYAIIRPVALNDDGRSEKMVLGSEVDIAAQASRADVAQVLASAAITGQFDGKALNMQSSGEALSAVLS